MSTKANLLFVDDEEGITNTLKRLFKSKYNVFTSNSGDEALEIARSNDIHVIVSDQRMPGKTGVELLSEIKQISPNSMRILLTGYADLSAALKAVNDGEIFRYITKPWDNSKIRNVVDMAADIAQKTPALKTMESGIELAPTNIVVIDNDPATYTAVSGMVNGAKTYQADSIDKVLNLLESDQNIGLIVSELKVGNDDVTELLSTMKAVCPSILTIVLTSFKDINTIVSLINGSQVYRFLPKPVNKSLLQSSIKHAMNRFAISKKNPTMLARSKVDTEVATNKEQEKPKSAPPTFSDRLKQILNMRVF